MPNSVTGDPDSASLPLIDVSNLRLRDRSQKALAALVEANQRRPRFFQRGGVLVRLRIVDRTIEIQALGKDALVGDLDRVANWLNSDKGGNGAIAPPEAVVRDILSLPQWDLPLLHA